MTLRVDPSGQPLGSPDADDLNSREDEQVVRQKGVLGRVYNHFTNFGGCVVCGNDVVSPDSETKRIYCSRLCRKRRHKARKGL